MALSFFKRLLVAFLWPFFVYFYMIDEGFTFQEAVKRTNRYIWGLKD